MLRNKHRYKPRRVLRLISRTWICLGLIALGYGTILTAFSPVVSPDGLPRIHFTASRDDARLSAAMRLWSEESGEMGDAFTAGRAAYDIATVTHDPKWAHEASRRFGEAREVLPGFAQATAWHGSAHSLIARDYPVQGAWQVLPGPGFARIYHVKRAEALLDAAVADSPDDPVVRLLRAATISQMPGLLTDHGVAMQDFALLARWEANPAQNPDHVAILTSAEWRREFLDAYALARDASGDPQLAETLRARAATLTNS